MPPIGTSRRGKILDFDRVLEHPGHKEQANFVCFLLVEKAGPSGLGETQCEFSQLAEFLHVEECGELQVSAISQVD